MSPEGYVSSEAAVERHLLATRTGGCRRRLPFVLAAVGAAPIRAARSSGGRISLFTAK